MAFVAFLESEELATEADRQSQMWESTEFLASTTTDDAHPATCIHSQREQNSLRRLRERVGKIYPVPDAW